MLVTHVLIRGQSEVGRSSKMYDCATEGILSPRPPISVQQEAVILSVDSVLEQNIISEYQHFSDAERCLNGTWIIDEVAIGG